LFDESRALKAQKSLNQDMPLSMTILIQETLSQHWKQKASPDSFLLVKSTAQLDTKKLRPKVLLLESMQRLRSKTKQLGHQKEVRPILAYWSMI